MQAGDGPGVTISLLLLFQSVVHNWVTEWGKWGKIR